MLVEKSKSHLNSTDFFFPIFVNPHQLAIRKCISGFVFYIFSLSPYLAGTHAALWIAF